VLCIYFPTAVYFEAVHFQTMHQFQVNQKYTILVHLSIFNTLEKLKVYEGNDKSNCNII